LLLLLLLFDEVVSTGFNPGRLKVAMYLASWLSIDTWIFVKVSFDTLRNVTTSGSTEGKGAGEEDKDEDVDEAVAATYGTVNFFF
jgi:hypothetical protein